jgi:hypothetical protein
MIKTCMLIKILPSSRPGGPQLRSWMSATSIRVSHPLTKYQRTRRSVLPDYVYHFVRQQGFRRDGEANMTGSVGQKRVPGDWIGATRLAIPPLDEQQRIVAKVDEVLSRTSAVQERLRKLLTIIKRFRQSVLAAACSGRLTAEWRKEHDVSMDGKALVKCVAALRGHQPPEMHGDLPALPSTWAWTSFGYSTRDRRAIASSLLDTCNFRCKGARDGL